MGRKQLHALLSTMFNSFHQRLDKDGIHTLIDVVIVGPT
jgi:hypothetical protein